MVFVTTNKNKMFLLYERTQKSKREIFNVLGNNFKIDYLLDNYSNLSKASCDFLDISNKKNN